MEGHQDKKRKKTFDNKDRSGPEYNKGKKDVKGIPNQAGGKPLSLQQQQQLAHAAYQFPVPEKGRPWTVSMALPGSIVDGALTIELKTYLVGQIARACVLFHVDEIVIYNDSAKGLSKEGALGKDDYLPKSDPNLFMGRVLQYLETPLYLRKLLFPMHRDLKFAGLLNPLDPPHHVQLDERSLYREGVVVRAKDSHSSIVNCGMRKEVLIDRAVPTGVRVTVKMDGMDKKSKPKMDKDAKAQAAIEAMEAALNNNGGNGMSAADQQKYFKGTVVSPQEPREKTGYYWGYQVRLADSISKVFTESPYANGYDLTIGTSDKGKPLTRTVTDQMPSFSHAVVFFGGANGVETAIEADEDLSCDAEDAKDMFDLWLNTCPNQGSRTLRTEEAILITMGQLQGPFTAKGV